MITQGTLLTPYLSQVDLFASTSIICIGSSADNFSILGLNALHGPHQDAVK